MGHMKTRFPLIAGCLLAVLAAAAPPASAAIVEVGLSPTDPTPSCPAKPCFAVSRTTGYQAKVGEQRALYTVPQDGRIVAWTISLAKPDEEQQSFFEEQFGGAASAGITVLRTGRKLYARTVATSPIQRLEPYFGSKAQFPLETSIEVKKGWVVALTVPTWAPSLAVSFGNDTSWRAASRRNGACSDLDTQVAQLKAGGIARYRCLFRTARLTYSATLVTSPTPTPETPAPPT
jgi:hypothetical protein